jgi:hypothetical protein
MQPWSVASILRFSTSLVILFPYRILKIPLSNKHAALILECFVPPHLPLGHGPPETTRDTQ